MLRRGYFHPASMKMNLRWNAKMLSLLGGSPEFLEPSSITMPDRLELEATSGFKQVDGFVVQSSLDLKPTPTSSSSQAGETGASLFTEINVDRFLVEPIGISELARLGLDFGFLLRKELTNSGIPGPFRIIVRVRPANGESNVSESCTVRFQTVQGDQALFYNDNDLQSIEDAIAVLDF